MWEVSHKLIFFGREQQKHFLRNEGEKRLLKNERGENIYIFLAILKPCKSYGAIALLSSELPGAGPSPSAALPVQLVLCKGYSSFQIKLLA